MIMANFAQMRDQASGGPLVMGIALHPYIVGQPYRLRYLRPASPEIAKLRDRIWLTRAGTIADHVRRLEPGIVP